METAKEILKKLILTIIKELHIAYLKEEISEEQYNEGIRNYTQIYFEQVGENLNLNDEEAK